MSDAPGAPGDADGSGPRLAQDALARARAAATAAQRESDRGAAARRRKTTRAANAASRKAQPFDTDAPVPFGAAIEDLLSVRGWRGEATVAKVTADWPGTVGADLAAHCTPVSLTEGVLTVAAESTAWATQIRLLSRTLLARVAADAGAGVVTRLVVRGPAGPSWRHGRLRVPGPGPRDTYG